MGKWKQRQRRVTRHRNGTYGQAGRTEGVYLSQEETLQKKTTEEVGGTVVLQVKLQHLLYVAFKNKARAGVALRKGSSFRKQSSILSMTTVSSAMEEGTRREPWVHLTYILRANPTQLVEAGCNEA